MVTVLFADLKGSLGLIADRDPEEARALLDPVLKLMIEAVRRYGGTVNQVMGDGLMALFGAPLADEGHAVSACLAALTIQSAAGRYAEEIRGSHGPELAVRVGLNSGEVVVHSTGDDRHPDYYAAVGPTTHLAARMEQMARPGCILATVHTLRLVEGVVETGSLGRLTVKGLDEPIEVFEVIGLGEGLSRLHARAARGLTAFVGREAEGDALARALALAGQGRGQVVALVGDAGVGKSRLSWEFARSSRLQGWKVLESGATPYATSTGFQGFGGLLRAYFRVDPTRADSRGGVREKVRAQLIARDARLEALLPALLTLLDVAPESPDWEGAEAGQRRERMREATKHLLLQESRVQPLLVVVEDLHWVDPETQFLLDGIVDGLAASRILLLVSYRPGYRHAWADKTYYTQVRVDALPPSSAHELLSAILGDDPALAALKEALVERTAGNPLFLEESVHALVGDAVLAGSPGSYRQVRSLPETIPPSVQAVIAARIDRLPLEEKALLQTAAAVGREVPLAILRAIYAGTPEELRALLDRLQAAEFLYETPSLAEPQYVFAHVLTHDVAYATLLRQQRRELHATILAAMERDGAGEMGEQIDRLAHHALKAEQWAEAVRYLRAAGRRATARSAHRQAVILLEQALTALTRLPESPQAQEAALEVRLELRNALIVLAEHDRIITLLREGEALAHALGDERRLSRVLAFSTVHYWLLGDYEQGIKTAERARALAEAHDDPSVRIAATYYLAEIHYVLGDYQRSAGLFRSIVEAVQGDLGRERFELPFLPSVAARAWLARCQVELGEFSEGVLRAEEAVELADSVDHAYSRIHAYESLGTLRLRRGEFDAARAMLERAVELCQTWNVAFWLPAATSSLGSAMVQAGAPAVGLALLERAIEQAQALQIRFAYAVWQVNLGEGYLLAGRIEDARQQCERAVRFARERGEKGHEAAALRLLGALLAHAGAERALAAEAHYRQALRAADDLVMRPLAGHCRLGLGRLYRKWGRREVARLELETAADLFRRMGMTLWVAQAESELAAT